MSAVTHRRRPPFRRGLIFLFGTRTIATADPAARPSADAACPKCGQAGTLAGRRARPWFTFFFIPLFPIGGGRRFTHCSNCGASFAVDPEQFAAAAARSDARQVQRSITLYNSLRASPGNSVTLLELLGLYAAAGEYDQAISAAAQFPDAVDASEQCMVAVGRVHALRNDPAEAVRWFDAALARNPDLGEAHYQKATALLDVDPPRAAAAARAARKAGHAGADELLAVADARVRDG